MQRFLDTDEHDPLRILSASETIAAMRADGYGPLLDALRQPECLTRAGGTLKISTVSRAMGISQQQVSNLVREVRQRYAA